MLLRTERLSDSLGLHSWLERRITGCWCIFMLVFWLDLLCLLHAQIRPGAWVIDTLKSYSEHWIFLVSCFGKCWFLIWTGRMKSQLFPGEHGDVRVFPGVAHVCAKTHVPSIWNLNPTFCYQVQIQYCREAEQSETCGPGRAVNVYWK